MGSKNACKVIFRTSYSTQIWLSFLFVQVHKAVVHFLELYPICKILKTVLLNTMFSQEPNVLKWGQAHLSRKIRSGANSNTALTESAFPLPSAILCSFNQNLLYFRFFPRKFWQRPCFYLGWHYSRFAVGCSLVSFFTEMWLLLPSTNFLPLGRTSAIRVFLALQLQSGCQQGHPPSHTWWCREPPNMHKPKVRTSHLQQMKANVPGCMQEL